MEKRIQRRRVCVDNGHVPARFGLVDIKMCTQECSTWPPPTFLVAKKCINNTSGGGRCGPDPKLHFQNGTLRSLEEEFLYQGTRQSKWDPGEEDSRKKILDHRTRIRKRIQVWKDGDSWKLNVEI
jgi:hypothetical protein